MLVRRKRKLAVTDGEGEEEEEDGESPLELHLTPLHGITQLRPSYEYLGEWTVPHFSRYGENDNTQTGGPTDWHIELLSRVHATKEIRLIEEERDLL